MIDNSAHSLISQGAWNEICDTYNEGRDVKLDSIEYGALCPLDDELNLIGDVAGLDVLDAGCGGGQNAICFARRDAIVTALDFSKNQLNHAEASAYEAGVEIEFVQDTIESLDRIASDSQDLVFCANVFPYVVDVEHALVSCRRVLRPDGRLVVSLDHPIRSCFQDTASSDMTNYPERNYFATEPRRWMFNGTATRMTTYVRTTGRWVDMLREGGLQLIQLLEPPVPTDILDELYPEDGPLASLRHIPHTLILVACASDDRHETEIGCEQR